MSDHTLIKFAYMSIIRVLTCRLIIHVKGCSPGGSISAGSVIFSDDCGYVSFISFLTVSLFQMEQFKCSECPAVFTEERNLLRHMTGQHTDGGSTFVCKDCGATYRRGDSLSVHIKDKHSDAVPYFLCEKCGLRFLFNREENEFRFFSRLKK